jgi:hypothetical protein
MKKFAVLMVFVLMLSVILTGCGPARDSGKTCDMVISPDKLQDYDGQKATIEGSHEGVTVLEIDGKHVCVTENGLYSTDVGEGLDLLVRAKYHQNEFGGLYTSLGYSFMNMYSGMTGTIHYLGQPVIVLDEVMQMVYKDNCTVLDQDSIGQLNGQNVKITGVWVPEGKLADEYYDALMVFEYNGQNYCYDYYVQAYKTIEVFGKPHHVPFDFGVMGNTPELLFGDVGRITVEIGDDGRQDVFLDIGEGEREDDVDPMIEEIGSRDMHLVPLKYEGMYSETFTDGKGSVYSLMYTWEAPILKPGYLISPKSYTYGGIIDVGTVIGKIDGKPLIVSYIGNCMQNDDGSFEAEFYISYDGGVVAYDWRNLEYFALVKGNGADQDIVYYQFSANASCKK